MPSKRERKKPRKPKPRQRKKRKRKQLSFTVRLQAMRIRRRVQERESLMDGLFIVWMTAPLIYLIITLDRGVVMTDVSPETIAVGVGLVLVLSNILLKREAPRCGPMYLKVRGRQVIVPANGPFENSFRDEDGALTRAGRKSLFVRCLRCRKAWTRRLNVCPSCRNDLSGAREIIFVAFSRRSRRNQICKPCAIPNSFLAEDCRKCGAPLAKEKQKFNQRVADLAAKVVFINAMGLVVLWLCLR